MTEAEEKLCSFNMGFAKIRGRFGVSLTKMVVLFVRNYHIKNPAQNLVLKMILDIYIYTYTTIRTMYYQRVG